MLYIKLRLGDPGRVGGLTYFPLQSGHEGGISTHPAIIEMALATRSVRFGISATEAADQPGEVKVILYLLLKLGEWPHSPTLSEH